VSRSERPIWLGEDARGWDHVRIHIQLLRDGHINAYDIAVYAGLVAHAELATGAAHPSEATLASYAKVSERTVRRSINKLRERGYIALKEEPGKANRYSVLPPPGTPATQSGVRPDPGQRVRGPRPHSPDTPARESAEQEPSNKSQVTIGSNSSKENYDYEPDPNIHEDMRKEITRLKRHLRAVRAETK
jgi:DNA-binding transcriptional MocR family regulator